MVLDGLFNLIHVILADLITQPFHDGFTCLCVFYPLISFFVSIPFSFSTV